MTIAATSLRALFAEAATVIYDGISIGDKRALRRAYIAACGSRAFSPVVRGIMAYEN